MTTPSADDKSTPGAAAGDEAAIAAASAAANSQGGDQAAADKAAADKAAADKTAADAAAAAAAASKPTKGAESLFEGVLDPAKAAADKAAADKVAADKAAADKAAADAQQHPEWFVADGVKGAGAPPAWFLADKYKTVADQAAAYPEVQKKFGAFTGAPKDGKYEIKLPDTVVGSIDAEHPMMQGLTEWAIKRNMNQEAFSEIIGQFAEYEASLVPTLEDIHADMGDNAVARINALGNWVKANLMPEELTAFIDATKGPNAAAVIKAVEAVVAKTRQISPGRPGADATAGAPNTESEINAMQARINPATGKRFYEEDSKYRAKVEEARMALYKAVQQPNRVIP